MWYIHTRSRELEPSPQKNSKRLYYDYMVIFVFYMTICVLPLVHRTPQKTKKGQNHQKMDVSSLVTIVTGFIFLFFLLILIGLDQTVNLVYYTTLYMHSLIRGTPKTLKNRQNGQKFVFLHGYHGY